MIFRNTLISLFALTFLSACFYEEANPTEELQAFGFLVGDFYPNRNQAGNCVEVTGTERTEKLVSSEGSLIACQAGAVFDISKRQSEGAESIRILGSWLILRLP